MYQTLLSFLFVLLIECISAVVAYLKDLLHNHMRRRGCNGGYDADSEPEFA